MATASSKVVVRNGRGEILLVLREDLHTWALPGGGCEPGETYEQAATRETCEETGYEVELDRFVGEYWRPQMPRGGDRQRLYLAHVTGGSPSAHDWESVDVRWFAADGLPRRMTRFSTEQILDALTDVDTPVKREQRLPWLQAVLLSGFLVLRRALNRVRRHR